MLAPLHVENARGERLPLGFVREEGKVFLVARERSALWPLEILRRGDARLHLPDATVRGRARLLSDPGERERVLGRFRSKYGEDLYGRWYAHPARVVEVEIDPSLGSGPAGPPPGEGAGAYYPWIEAEFDNVAAEYDRHILGNRMNRLLRERSLARLREVFAGATSLLEVGCGSGMETLPLLRDGHEVTAVDISERMLDVVRTKAANEGVVGRLRTRRMAARDLPALVAELGGGAFDGAYSTYGALNCEPDLRPLEGALHRLLRPSSRLFLGVYNRWCLFEMLGYGLVGRWSRAVGRRHRPVPVGTSRFCVDVFAYTPGDLARVFGRSFRVRRLQAVPVLLPPSDLHAYAERFARHFELLDRLDGWMGSRWPWTLLGDHFLMELERR